MDCYECFTVCSVALFHSFETKSRFCSFVYAKIFVSSNNNTKKTKLRKKICSRQQLYFCGMVFFCHHLLLFLQQYIKIVDVLLSLFTLWLGVNIQCSRFLCVCSLSLTEFSLFFLSFSFFPSVSLHIYLVFYMSNRMVCNFFIFVFFFICYCSIVPWAVR